MNMFKRNSSIAFASLALALGAIGQAQTTQVSLSQANANIVRQDLKSASKDDRKFTPVNLNTASAKDLETLPGVGPRIAAEIVKNRPYKDATEFQAKVKGIGPSTWALMQKYVLFK